GIDRSVSVTVYRIVQESLTNARKYGTGEIDIDIETAGEEIHVTIANPVASDVGPGEGFGLVGMRERAASVHGFLRAGTEDGRFVVRAALPAHPHQREGGRT
ncbi:MAG: sensor histidine kinase, partial [Humibacter sp.]